MWNGPDVWHDRNNHLNKNKATNNVKKFNEWKLNRTSWCLLPRIIVDLRQLVIFSMRVKGWKRERTREKNARTHHFSKCQNETCSPMFKWQTSLVAHRSYDSRAEQCGVVKEPISLQREKGGWLEWPTQLFFTSCFPPTVNMGFFKTWLFPCLNQVVIVTQTMICPNSNIYSLCPNLI